jgi:hypothetical protein
VENRGKLRDKRAMAVLWDRYGVWAVFFLLCGKAIGCNCQTGGLLLLADWSSSAAA